MAQVENKDLLEEKKSLSEEIALINKRWVFGHNSSEEGADDENFLGQTWPRSWKMV